MSPRIDNSLPQGLKLFKLPMPIRGLSKQFAFDAQPTSTCPASNNVWIIDSPTGRYRVGPRAALKSTGGPSGSAPYGWCRVTYNDGNTLKIGLAVTTSAGTFFTFDGVSFGGGTNPGDPVIASTISEGFPTQASCACFLKVLFEAASAAAQIKYRILPPPGTGGNLQDKVTADGVGTAPTHCGVVIAHGDRLWALNKRDAPHTVYASAVGSYIDWDYADPTDGGAFVNTGSEGGILGEPALAAISHNHNVLLVGGPTSVYAYRGNPKTGTVRKISEHIGPLSHRSWCKGADDYTYMMTPLGLYRIPPGDGSTPEPCGEEIPNDLIGLNPYNGDIIAVGYDHRWRMVHIFVDRASGSDLSYAWKLPTATSPGSWWQQSFANTSIHLAATFPEMISGDVSSLLAFQSNCTSLRFDRTGTETYSSYIVLGPYQLGGESQDGAVHAVTASLAKFSDLWTNGFTGHAAWNVYTAESAESAFNNVDPNGDGSFTNEKVAFAGSAWTRSGWNYRQHPKVRGAYFCLKIGDSPTGVVTNSKWLLEGITAEVAGGYKKLVQAGERIND